MSKAASRFEVSSEGFAQLHAGREPWKLIKELIANSWDEEVTEVGVTIAPTDSTKLIEVRVEDNGPGFADARDAWVLMSPSKKRGEATTRGRFNVGEKEIISVAVEAKIETVGTTVYFPASGGRYTKPNSRERGTVVTLLMPWEEKVIPETVQALLRFWAPKGVRTTVNEFVIAQHDDRTEGVYKFDAVLDTHLQNSPGEPMRLTTRKGKVTVAPVYKDGPGTIFEMGIPVQEIDAPYLVNVGQKVPLTQNRDMVPPYYLKAIYAEVLQAVVGTLTEESASEPWVGIGLSDRRTKSETVKAVIKARFGDKVALWSSDPTANERALEAGYNLIPRGALSGIERDLFTGAGVKSAAKEFAGLAGAKPEVTVTAEMSEVAQYAKLLAKVLVGIDIRVDFVRVKKPVMASWGAGTLTFNMHTLGSAFFAKSPTVDQTDLILHELAHAEPSLLAHQGDYVNSLSRLGALLAHKLAGSDITKALLVGGAK